MQAHLSDSLAALVVPDDNLILDMISYTPLKKLGYDILLKAEGNSWIMKGDLPLVPIIPHQNHMLVDIKALQCLAVTTEPSTNNDPTLANISSLVDRVLALHRRMGHPTLRRMIDAISSRAWDTDVTSAQVAEVLRYHHNPCNVCNLAKRNHIPIPQSHTDPTQLAIGQLISGDIIGPITPLARPNLKYFFLFVERRTSRMTCFASPTKDGFLTSLVKVIKSYKDRGHSVQTFLSDSEQIMYSIAHVLVESDITPEYSLPYEHHQNLVERHVQTIVKSTSAIIHDQTLLNATFWKYALDFAVNTWNNTPNTKTAKRTPNQMVNNTNHSVALDRTYLFPFGAPVAVRNPSPAWRFDLKRDVGVYLGPSKGSVNGGLVYLPYSNSIAARGDLIELQVTPSDFHRYSQSRENIKDLDDNHFHIGIPQSIPETNTPAMSNIPKTTTTLPSIKLSNRQAKKIVRRMLTRSMTGKRTMKVLVAHTHHHNELKSALEGPEKEQ